MYCFNLPFKAVVAAQIFGLVSPQIASAGGSSGQDYPMLIPQDRPMLIPQNRPMLTYLDEVSSETSMSTDVRSVAASPSGDGLMLSVSDPETTLQFTLTDLRCATDAGPTDLEILAVDDSGHYLIHAKVMLDKTDRDSDIGQGSITDNKSNHGKILVDEIASRLNCDPVANQWNLLFSSYWPISDLLVMPVARDARGPKESDMNDGVTLLPD